MGSMLGGLAALLGLGDRPQRGGRVPVVATTFVFGLVVLLVLGFFIESLFVRSMILGALVVTLSWLRTKRGAAGNRET